ncbi:hypothetical protein CLW00_10233 [Mongoliibacter ruber]|uniref:Uncharacterized protein n=1 Tax=Mongoliibacter ruber TaxID=1750599 RepID=A0A2T0WS78_9BACT|nr:hypothetical protein CLW00_10233 [Mongoliibacter ruber]
MFDLDQYLISINIEMNQRELSSSNTGNIPYIHFGLNDFLFP